MYLSFQSLRKDIHFTLIARHALDTPAEESSHDQASIN